MPDGDRRARLESLDDVKGWIWEHDGRIDAWWDGQRRWNERHERNERDLLIRLIHLERRIAWYAGAAAGLGAVVGAIVAAALDSVIGG